MDRRDLITLAVIGVLAAGAYVALFVMTLLEGSAYIKFAVAVALMVVILVGAFWFVLTPQKQREKERDTD
jgi:FtsH-binding integral membrane protein